MQTNRYIGKVCVKHPDIGGLRVSNSRECPKCHNAKSILRRAQLRKDPVSLEKERARERASRARNRFKHRARNLAYENLRRSRKLQRVPRWVGPLELKLIQVFYDNCSIGWHVDHIIPLQGKLVSGLHCLGNFQYLPARDNISKGSSFDGSLVNGSFPK